MTRPPIGPILSVNPVLARDDHDSLNGYANNITVTKSDSTGLRPITDCEHGCSDGRYRDHMTLGPNGTWVDHSTKTFRYQKAGGGTGSGTMTVPARTDGGHETAQVTFMKGPDPKPQKVVLGVVIGVAAVVVAAPVAVALGGAAWPQPRYALRKSRRWR
ncbi:hypothetical protein [Streptomyces sp. NBC_00620]|uniref:hypothetical protein n=1 Tax=Streptomyces sp. NBC_00620 TaxID=2903666 RepID=UPI002251E7FB|nr:hypothetical protein [Streptomyces sp. NBC_00620]MCX4978526.1 hypothetical protein [Streptomyces sp. NBC_00620]